MRSQHFYSNGKLLLTGEYAVLDGALALGLPSVYGQSLEVYENIDDSLQWKSYDCDNNLWFSVNYLIESNNLKLCSKEEETASLSDRETSLTLIKILREAQRLNPAFLNLGKGYLVESHLNFPRNWGLGSSSTLINNIAQWAHVDPYQLLWNSFGGSGYDIACAQHNTPILYQQQAHLPKVRPVAFDPVFKDKLYFVYLNQKQSSKQEIVYYKDLSLNRKKLVSEISKITENTVKCDTIEAFNKLMQLHENLLSKALEAPPISEMFKDYSHGVLKSLGAWGGDFILATANEDPSAYFKQRGYTTVVAYRNMVLNKK